MAGRNYSIQRKAIYDFLAGRRDHPTADVIYDGIRKNISNISLGTVYRNLNLLSDSGRIRKVDCGDGLEHFDANTDAHQHFVCENCGCIEDIFLGELPELVSFAAKSFDGEIVTTDVVFRGTCSRCKNKAHIQEA